MKKKSRVQFTDEELECVWFLLYKAGDELNRRIPDDVAWHAVDRFRMPDTPKYLHLT